MEFGFHSAGGAANMDLPVEPSTPRQSTQGTLQPSQSEQLRIVSANTAGKVRIFNDPIHGHFELSKLSSKIIDSRPFQRLRHLKQLGLAYYVFPGASHNRFEHSLGVAHLGRTYARILLEKFTGPDGRRYSEPEIDRFVLLVEVAGLCHDLGHGPFSHVFESEVLPRIIGRDHGWCHEQMSEQLLDFILQTQHIDLTQYGLLADDNVTIKKLISGISPRDLTDEDCARCPPFLYEIVANKRNSLDVDKFDYLQRDSQYANTKISTSFDRFPYSIRVSQNGREIVHRWKERSEVMQVFHDRADMHKKVYSHKTSKAIELMAADAIALVEDQLRIREKIQHPGTFIDLSDCIFDHIQCWLDARMPNVAAAKNLLNRVANRDLYVLAMEVHVPSEDIRKLRSDGVEWKKPTEEDLVACLHKSPIAQGLQMCPLEAQHIRVIAVKINYGMKDKNPMESVGFYKEGIDNVIFEKVKEWQKESYEEIRVRVYATEVKYKELAFEALCCWAEHSLSRVIPSSHFREQVDSAFTRPSRFVFADPVKPPEFDGDMEFD